MRTQNSKVKITIDIPFGIPDCNGTIYTKEAVEKCVHTLLKGIPITFADDKNERKLIGTTISNNPIMDWDSDNQICKVTLDGVVFYAGADIIVNEMEDGKITDCEIRSIGLTI